MEFDDVPERRANVFRLDKSINVGNIFTILIILFTLLQMYTGIVNRMTAMENKVDLMWSQFAFRLKDNIK